MWLRGLDPLSGCRLAAPFVLLASFLFLGGCGRNEPAADVTKLMLMVQFQRQFTEDHAGQEPQSADELRAWVKQIDPKELEARRITDVDSLFVSSRDGQPFVMVPRAKGAMTAAKNRIVAYEQVGVDQKRLVAFDLGQVLEMEEGLLVHLQEDHVPD